MAEKIDQDHLTRRGFIGASVAAIGSTALGMGTHFELPLLRGKQKPNFLFIICDQLSLDSIQAYGCRDVSTPNIDRLIKGGTSFLESHSTSPVCSPARSSLMTGRMPVETGVISNDRPINASIPNIGQWFRRFGYDTAYCGKWHLPFGYADKIEGFDVLPAGGGQGDLVDGIVSRNCQAYMETRENDKPFLLVASLLQPHDICYWAIHNKRLVPEQSRFGLTENKLPQLPPNFDKIPIQPQKLSASRYDGFNEYQWKYYSYIYYRQIEMLDADVGRVLDALDQSGQTENTVVIFTSDHGEGLGRHKLVQKWHPYEESMKVPLVVSAPQWVKSNYQDSKNLVSGIDIMPTLCDFAGIAAPEDCRGLSLKPLLQGKKADWRTFISADTNFSGQIIRTSRYKYAKYSGDSVEMLFDMQTDPYETKNLYGDPQYTEIIAQHRQLLTQWNASLKPVTPSPEMFQ